MKNIVICSDGTGNEYGKNNTNVVELYSVCKHCAGQLAFYDPGVGTGGWEYDEELGKLSAKADQATGNGLQKNVEDAYRILMSHYESGDRVFLFGFSRGAFTVRALAGMLHKCGLLRPGNENLVTYASKIYNTHENPEVAAGFGETFSVSCPVHFVGVWDTVESLAMNAGKKFFDAKLNQEVSYGYQALAIDERRRDFPPSIWNESNVASGQTIEQVWFAGAHADVGGWFDERGLANISLRWMLEKAGQQGLELDHSRIAGYEPDPHDKLHESYSGFWRFRGSRRRKIPDRARVHASVRERMEKESNRYSPKNFPENPVYV